MTLELRTFHVRTVEFGPHTALVDGRLTIDRAEIRRIAMTPAAIADVAVELVAPGEPTRIIHVMDAIEPRIKVGGESVAFPGLLGPPRTVGRGVTHRLGGLAVLESAVLPEVAIGGLEFNEGLIDMSGPGAAYSACSDTHDVVLVFTPRPGVGNREFEAAFRLGALLVARRLAETTLGEVRPDDVEHFDLGNAAPDAPRVAYVDMVQQVGFLCQTLLYGHPVDAVVPTVLDPREYFDGAVVSASYRNPTKTPTWLRQNHPVIRALFRRHPRELNFVGVIFCRGHLDDHELKERNGEMVANVARLIGADGVVQGIDGSGNIWVDFMLAARALERAGIRTVQIVHELGGAEGRDWPVLDYTPEADAIVSGGGADRRFQIPAVRRVVGGTHVTFNTSQSWGKTVDASSALTVSANEMYAGFLMMQTNGFSAHDA
jgi:glycine reductase complex component B subunit alpha and beta